MHDRRQPSAQNPIMECWLELWWRNLVSVTRDAVTAGSWTPHDLSQYQL